ncbi:hypothetical protein B1218_35095, partial [Pseudomonas ogarae]
MAAERQDGVRGVKREDAGNRESVREPVGIPVARQRVVAGQWEAEGLLPPDAEAREWFAALLFALTQEAE